jgi:hypothetical protein
MDKFRLNCEDLKLISNGKVLKDDLNLNTQDVKVSPLPKLSETV